MAKISQGYMGPVIGRLGTAVGYVWRGRYCMRSLPAHYHDRRSEAQLEQRDRFLAMVRFASSATSVLKHGMLLIASREQMTEGNVFVRDNKRHFLVERGSGAVRVDYARLQLSSGSGAPVALTGVVVDADGVLSATWDKCNELRGARGQDVVWLYAYCPACGNGVALTPSRRSAARATALLPDAFRGCGVHLYAFTENAAGDCSATSHAATPCGELSYDDAERPASQDFISDDSRPVADLAARDTDTGVAMTPMRRGSGGTHPPCRG